MTSWLGFGISMFHHLATALGYRAGARLCNEAAVGKAAEPKYPAC